MMPLSRPPTAHFFPTRVGSRACSHETKNASASRCTMVGGPGMVIGSERAACRVNRRPKKHLVHRIRYSAKGVKRRTEFDHAVCPNRSEFKLQIARGMGGRATCQIRHQTLNYFFVITYNLPDEAGTKKGMYWGNNMNTEAIQDAELVSKFNGGDESAFGEIMNRHKA